MNARTRAADVVAAYSARLPFVTAEVDAVPAPTALPLLINDQTHVVELPCGPGHFLAAYAAARSRLTLVDGNSEVLGLARTRALAAGIDRDRVRTRCALLAELGPLDGVGVAVLPGGALNQLAAQTSLSDQLALLRRALPAATRLVGQVCCRHNDGEVDRASFFDMTRPDDVWATDRRWPAGTGGSWVVRRRRHHRDGDRYRVAFAYLSETTGGRLHETAIELVVPQIGELAELLDDAGFTHVELTAGRTTGLTELVCTAARRRGTPS